MRKGYVLLALVTFISTTLWATTYQTFDVGGVIKWSTDGGMTDCGCQASAAVKSDSISVLHPYTFPVGYFTDGEIEAPISVMVGLGDTVKFEDDIILFKVALWINNTTVEFNGNFDITGAGQNISGVFVSNSSIVSFNGDFGSGNNQDNSLLSLANSQVNFAQATNVTGILLITEFASSVHIGANAYFEKSIIFNSVNSSLNIGDNTIFDDTDILFLSNSVTLGEQIKFYNKSTIDFGDNMSITLPSTTRFRSSVIHLISSSPTNGAIVNFTSGITLEASELHVANGSIVNMVDANMTAGIGTSIITLDGLLNLDSLTIITNTAMTIQSNGIVNLEDVICDPDFEGSTVNGNKNDAADILICGDVYNPDDNEFNVFENGVWSQGFPPLNVGVLAEVRDTYESSVDGDILCGNLFIAPNIDVIISSEGYFRATQDFNNLGNLIVENSASLVMDESTYVHEDNGLIEVQRIGQLSSMRFNVWSSPIQSADILFQFDDTNPCDMYAFEANTQTWKYDFVPFTEVNCNGNISEVQPESCVSGADGFMDPGRGYFFPGNDVSEIRSFLGKVNNGDIIRKVKTTALGQNPNWDGDDWNLLGNPYPSALDLNKFWGKNALESGALTDAVYFWVETVDPPYDDIGSYEAWNFTGGTYYLDVNGKANGFAGIVPACKGFWVVANDPQGNGGSIYDVVFDNTMRDINQVSNAQSIKATYPDSDRERMWINMYNDSNQFDQVLIGTHPEATDSIDLLYDAHVNYGGEPMVLSVQQKNEYFTIAGYAPRIMVDTTEIELLVVASNMSDHKIVLDSALHYLNYKKVFLVDKEKGTEQQMILDQPIVLDLDSAGAYQNRFFLKVTNSFVTSTEEVDVVTGKIWSFENTISYAGFTQQIETIVIYDLRGVQIAVFNPNNTNGNMDVPISSEGLYIIEATDKSGNRTTQKVYLK